MDSDPQQNRTSDYRPCSTWWLWSTGKVLLLFGLLFLLLSSLTHFWSLQKVTGGKYSQGIQFQLPCPSPPSLFCFAPAADTRNTTSSSSCTSPSLKQAFQAVQVLLGRTYSKSCHRRPLLPQRREDLQPSILPCFSRCTESLLCHRP